MVALPRREDPSAAVGWRRSLPAIRQKCLCPIPWARNCFNTIPGIAQCKCGVRHRVQLGQFVVAGVGSSADSYSGRSRPLSPGDTGLTSLGCLEAGLVSDYFSGDRRPMHFDCIQLSEHQRCCESKWYIRSGRARRDETYRGRFNRRGEPTTHPIDRFRAVFDRMFRLKSSGPLVVRSKRGSSGKTRADLSSS